MIKKFCDICGEEIDNDSSNIWYLSFESSSGPNWSLDVCENCKEKLKLSVTVKRKLKELMSN